MAGHSKWANTKHRKEGQDAKRGKIFTKLIREITSLAHRNPNPDQHAALRLAIDRALAANMSRDTIQRAIDRASGVGKDEQMEAMLYEGYGLEGLAYLVRALTDNRNRTVAQVRHAFDKCSGSLATEGSVAYLFQVSGWVVISGSLREADWEPLLAYDVLDILEEPEVTVLLCSPDSLASLAAFVRGQDYEILEANSGYRPLMSKKVSPEAQIEHQKLMALLMDLDDVQAVYCNLDETGADA